MNEKIIRIHALEIATRIAIADKANWMWPNKNTTKEEIIKLARRFEEYIDSGE